MSQNFFKQSGSYIDYPDWISKEDNQCFQYAVTVALNHEEIGKYSQRITKTKRFTNKYRRKETKYPSEKDDLEKLKN